MTRILRTPSSVKRRAILTSSSIVNTSLRQELHGFSHAVLTAEIAAIRYGQTQIGYSAIKAVYQLRWNVDWHAGSLHKG
ncbi:MAG: hypothetical protein CM15mP74_26120 [Halieaceae bacterium]|nr:MAG: hypothetical protein CM15mP74_26120 [Halieaceae bacterium]